MRELEETAEESINGFRDEFSIEKLDDGYNIRNPFFHSDGEGFHIVCREIDGRKVLTDDGWTFSWLDTHDVTVTPARMRVLRSVLENHMVELAGDRLIVECSASHGADVSLLIEAIVHVEDLCYLDRRHVRSTFVEDVRSVLSERIPDCETGKILSDPLGDEYRTDAFIGGDRPVMVFAVRSKDRCKDVTMALMALKDLGYESVVVVEEGADVPKKDLDRLEKHSDRTVGLKDLPALADSIAASR